LPMNAKGLQSLTLAEDASGMCGAMLLLLGCGTKVFCILALLLRFPPCGPSITGVCERLALAHCDCQSKNITKAKEHRMKFRPLHDRVVVKRIEAEEKSAGGIIIPDTAKE